MSANEIIQDSLVTRQKRALEVIDQLQQFYGEPSWRNPLPALDELVSTILSQNTNDHNRDAAYLNLRTRFPTWEAVRDAPPEQVIACHPLSRFGQSERSSDSAGFTGNQHGTGMS